MQKFQNTVNNFTLLTGLTHLFCCVLPMIASLASLLAGASAVSFMPSVLLEFHEIMHEWERPMMIFSGVMLLSGWLLHALSLKLDCRSTGCAHEPCAPKKLKASKILLVATGLFALNVVIYFGFHG